GAHFDAGLDELPPVAARRAERAEGVVQHADADAGTGALGERVGEAPTGRVVADDVVLEVHPAARGGDRGQHRVQRTRAVGMMLEAIAFDRPRAGGTVERQGQLVARGERGGRRSGNAHPTAACAPRPSAPSAGRSARITKAMCSSSGTPSSAAPWVTSSRFTPRANPLSLSFFFTDATSRSAKLLEGRTSAHATRNPHSSSTANSV